MNSLIKEAVINAFSNITDEGIIEKDGKIRIHYFNWTDIMIDNFKFYLVVGEGIISIKSKVGRDVIFTPVCHIGSVGVDVFGKEKVVFVRFNDLKKISEVKEDMLDRTEDLKQHIAKAWETVSTVDEIYDRFKSQVPKKLKKQFREKIKETYTAQEQRRYAGIIAMCIIAKENPDTWRKAIEIKK